jgi:hypothetical protein
VKKLNLDVSALEVESFQTSWLGSWAGTVHGQNDATAGGNTKCGGIHTCGQGCLLSEGPVTHCGGVQTCGDGCPRPVSEGPVTQCGGVQTCGAGCNA